MSWDSEVYIDPCSLFPSRCLVCARQNNPQLGSRSVKRVGIGLRVLEGADEFITLINEVFAVRRCELERYKLLHVPTSFVVPFPSPNLRH